MEKSYRLVALRICAERGERDPLRDDDPDHTEPVNPAELGVSGELAEQLRAGNERFNALAWIDHRWLDADEEGARQQEGLRSARPLQNELPDVEISYGQISHSHDGDDWPLRQRRGR